MANDAQKSRYPEFTLPEKWTTNIPPHLLAQLDDGQRYLLETVQTVDAKLTWALPKMLEMNTNVRDTDVRLHEIEIWKIKFASKWGLLAAGGALLVSACAGAFASTVFGMIFK